jgi:hypothetical protein
VSNGAGGNHCGNTKRKLPELSQPARSLGTLWDGSRSFRSSNDLVLLTGTVVSAD